MKHIALLVLWLNAMFLVGLAVLDSQVSLVPYNNAVSVSGREAVSY
jgi:hypothetical protein